MKKRKKAVRAILLILLFILAIILAMRPALRAAGHTLVRSDPPEKAQAAVVLFHLVDVYPRMQEAARLYREGLVERVVINGGRKLPLVREMEKAGMKRAWDWTGEYLPVLEFLGVPREKVLAVTAEDAFDTVSEASAVGRFLQDRGLTDIVIATSRYHTRRAGWIWERMYPSFRIRVVPAGADFFDPSSWWKDGRQVKVLLSEYGAWFFLLWRGSFVGA